MSKTVGVLYICTGKYSVFWDVFYSSAKEFLFQDCKLKFFIFTDDVNLLSCRLNDVQSFHLEPEPWPYPTLMRFRNFLSIEGSLSDVDYLVFCNANLEFKKPIDADLFFRSDYFAVKHPGYSDKDPSFFPIETNSLSTAFTVDRLEHYVCGGFNGGLRDSFLNMCRLLDKNIREDLASDIIAIWHDETHFNKFVNTNLSLFSIFPSTYCSPQKFSESSSRASDSFVIVLDKSRVIGVTNKGIKYAFVFYVSSIFNFFKSAFNRYL